MTTHGLLKYRVNMKINLMWKLSLYGVKISSLWTAITLFFLEKLKSQIWEDIENEKIAQKEKQHCAEVWIWSLRCLFLKHCQVWSYWPPAQVGLVCPTLLGRALSDLVLVEVHENIWDSPWNPRAYWKKNKCIIKPQ